MKPWVEDIIQALENLGGKAHRRDIINEVRRIRTEPIPVHLEETIQERIQAYSSDSAHFQNRGDYFKKIGNGIWALRDQAEQHINIIAQAPKSNASNHHVSRLEASNFENNRSNNSWVVDIVQALISLGGEAHRKQIIEEVKRIRTEPLPVRLEETVQRTIQNNSSDSKGFKGNDLFQKMGNGFWKLRDQDVASLSPSPSPRKKPLVNIHNSPPESSEEIANILRTIKEYRDYFDPESPNWREYIATLFQILGFSTENENTVLMKLHLMGSDDHIVAIVWNMSPGEDPENAWSSIGYEKRVFPYMAESLNTQWIVVTNGLYLKIIRFKGKKVIQKFFWQDFDTIVHQVQLDTFYQIFKVFSLIKSDSNQ
jgi:hypothetical protein